MPGQTLWDVWLSRGRVHMRCAYGKREGLKSIRECGFQAEIDLMTFMITRGRASLLSDMALKMRCPMCGSYRVTVWATFPDNTSTMTASRRAAG